MIAPSQYRMSPGDLETTLALVRGGTLATAGERLGVDASTVFRSLQRIERGLGRPLFERTRSGYLATGGRHPVGRARRADGGSARGGSRFRRGGAGADLRHGAHHDDRHRPARLDRARAAQPEDGSSPAGLRTPHGQRTGQPDPARCRHRRARDQAPAAASGGQAHRSDSCCAVRGQEGRRAQVCRCRGGQVRLDRTRRCATRAPFGDLAQAPLPKGGPALPRQQHPVGAGTGGSGPRRGHRAVVPGRRAQRCRSIDRTH